jgi:hypothetical protein
VLQGRWVTLGERPGQPLKRVLGPVLVLVLVLVLFLWPVWILGYQSPPAGGDTWKQLYPVWSYIGEHVRQGVVPLWNTRMMGGEPVIGEPQYGLLNPLNWLLFLAYPLPEWLVLLRVALPLLLGGVGMFLYLSRSPVWRLRAAAALLGSVAYMLADPFVVHLGHPQYSDVLGWLPWCLLAIDEAVERPRAAPMAAIPLALLAAGGHAQAVLYAAGVLVLYGVWRAVDGAGPQVWRRAAAVVVAAAVAMGVVAPIALPAIERYPHTERAAQEVVPATGYQWRLDTLLDLLSPHFHGRGVEGLWVTGGRVDTAYVGAVALFLALVGFVADIRRRRTWFLLFVGLFSVLLALGYNGPLFPLLARIDFLARMEKTSRVAGLISFVLAAGAALGAQHLLASERVRRVGVLLLIGIGAALWLGAPTISQLIPAGERYERALWSLRAAAVLAALLAVCVQLVRLAPACRCMVVALLAAELIASGAFVEVEPPSTAADHDAALSYLKADSGWFRVDVDSEAVELWAPHSLVAEGFAMPRTVGNPMELRAFNLFYWGQASKTSVGYRLLGVKYIVVAKDAPPGGEGITPVFVDDPLVDLHLHTLSLPRAWLVYRTVGAEDMGEAMSVMSQAGFDPWQTATVRDGPLLDGEGEGWIELLAYEPNRVAMKVQVSAPALLILSDVVYPGWQAWLDREPVPIYAADAVFRGVAVPPGDHSLELRYRPFSLWLGLGIASATLLAVAVAGLVGRHRFRVRAGQPGEEGGSGGE